MRPLRASITAFEDNVARCRRLVQTMREVCLTVLRTALLCRSGGLQSSSVDGRLPHQIGSRLILTDEELPTFNALMKRLSEYSTLSSAPVAIINPNAEDGARLGDAYLLADFAVFQWWGALLDH